MDIILLIAHISSFSPLPIIVFSFFIKKIPLEVRIIQWILILGFIFDMTCLFIIKRGTNNYPLYNVFLCVQILLLVKLYAEVLTWGRTVFLTIVLVLIFLFAIDYFLIQGPYVFNSYFSWVTVILMLTASLLYFKYLLSDLPVEYVHRMPMAWINIAILIYFSGNMFLFLLNNYLTLGSDGNQRVVWVVHNLLNITKNLTFFIAVWQSWRKNNLLLR